MKDLAKNAEVYECPSFLAIFFNGNGEEPHF